MNNKKRPAIFLDVLRNVAIYGKRVRQLTYTPKRFLSSASVSEWGMHCACMVSYIRNPTSLTPILSATAAQTDSTPINARFGRVHFTPFCRACSICLLAMVATACTQPAIKETRIADGVPVLKPKAMISLEYPNPEDFNDLIALTKDGRYLIDASETARNIRVWDWQNEKVVQKLLLNEGAPEKSDGKRHQEMLEIGSGQQMELTPDGRMVAACVNIPTPHPLTGQAKVMVRVWNLANGEVAADIFGTLLNVVGMKPGNILQTSCDSISFSPDGQYMAVLNQRASVYEDEAHFVETITRRKADVAAREAGLSEKKPAPPVRSEPAPEFLSGIALYETRNWQLLRFIPVPWIRQTQNDNERVIQEVHSRILFTSDSKQVIGAIYETNANRKTKPPDDWVARRIMRWDVATGIMLEEREVPQLSRPQRFAYGIWWHWLPGDREIWWETYDDVMMRQTKAEALHCKAELISPPFASDAVENCAYRWAVAVMDLASAKIRYLAPFRKWPPEGSRSDQSSVYRAAISPDGSRLIFREIKMHWSKPGFNEMTIDLFDMAQYQIKGRFYWVGEASHLLPVFSGDSRYFAIRANALRAGWEKWLGKPSDTFATIFEISGTN